MVAVLFRTLDAFRIFDDVFIMTNGASGTATVVVRRVRPDHQPARDRPRVSATRCCSSSAVLIICVGFIKFFKVDLAQARGEN